MPRARIESHRLGRRVLRPIWLSVAVVIVPAVSACSERSIDCTLIGSDSGVSVTVDPALLPATARAKVTACVKDVCHAENSRDSGSSVFVVLSQVKRGQTKVTVSIATGARKVFSAQTTTETIKHQPNGPGCPPTVWVAQVTATASGQLIG